MNKFTQLLLYMTRQSQRSGCSAT